MTYTNTTKPDIAHRLLAKAHRMDEVLKAGVVYDVRWREVFINTAGLFTEAAQTIETQGREIMRLTEQLELAHEIMSSQCVAKTPQG